MTEEPKTEEPGDDSRTVQVLARLTSPDVHQAAKALPSKSQQQLARSLGVPISVLTSSGNAAELVRRRAHRLETRKASALGRDLAEACVVETIAALGEHHDHPSYDDLLGVLEPICARWRARLVALMLAATADADFNAAAVCARVLDEDPRFALDTLGPVEQDSPAAPIGAPAPTVTDADLEAKRQQRRQRRESKKAKQPAKRAEAPSYRRRRGPASKESVEQKSAGHRATASERLPFTAQGHPVSTSSASMRPATVVGSYEELDHDHELIGAVVHAYIPFRDPTPDGEEGKMRPCIVIAACAPDSLVVRPCYSEGGARAEDWRSVRVTDTLAAGLDKNSYVSTQEFVIERVQAEPIRGWLARDDWNAL
jgi:hypothetical protein